MAGEYGKLPQFRQRLLKRGTRVARARRGRKGILCVQRVGRGLVLLLLAPSNARHRTHAHQNQQDHVEGEERRRRPDLFCGSWDSQKGGTRCGLGDGRCGCGLVNGSTVQHEVHVWKLLSDVRRPFVPHAPLVGPVFAERCRVAVVCVEAVDHVHPFYHGAERRLVQCRAEGVPVLERDENLRRPGVRASPREGHVTSFQNRLLGRHRMRVVLDVRRHPVLPLLLGLYAPGDAVLHKKAFHHAEERNVCEEAGFDQVHEPLGPPGTAVRRHLNEDVTLGGGAPHPRTFLDDAGLAARRQTGERHGHLQASRGAAHCWGEDNEVQIL
eukprot:Rhum_TRINITY_DN22948_c0_g1::Rhum_TRINITY_DN22948_c0_g1_i1::g.176586::m.176586